MKKAKLNKRIIYLAGFILGLVTEVLIALFVHDNFVRPYIGDVLVVIVLYAFLRIFIPEKGKLLPLWICIFAVCVELAQAAHIVELLGLGDVPFFRVLIGSVFDIKDIICYVIGCALLGVHEVIKYLAKNGVFLSVLFLIGLLFLPGYGAHLDQYSEQEIMYYNVYAYCERFGIDNGFTTYLSERNIINIQDSVERDHGMSVFYPMAFIWKLRDVSVSMANLVWHLYIYLVCFAGVICLYLLVKELFNKKTAIFTTLFYFFTPRIFAEIHYNNKDAILLSLAFISFYFGWRLKKNCNFKNAILFGCVGAVVSNMRIIGLFVWGIIGLWALISLIAEKRFNRFTLLQILVCFAGFALLFTAITPAVWAGPIQYIKYQITSSKDFRWGASLLFNGKIYSKDLTGFSRKYLPVIIVMTSPIAVMVLSVLGFAYFIKSALKKGKDKKSITRISFIAATMVAGLFPLTYAVLSNATVYNGWRHFYFSYSAIIILLSAGVYCVTDKWDKKHIASIAFSIILGLYFIGICVNHPYQYAYYNLPSRFIVKDCFELDYWDMSFKQALEYIAENEDKKVTVAAIDSPSVWGVQAQLNNGIDGKYSDKLNLISEWRTGEYNLELADYVIINPTYSFIYSQELYDYVQNNFEKILEIKSYGNVICEIYCTK